MRDQLDRLGAVLQRLLNEHLPALGDDWWHRGVVSALSFPQRQIVNERGWNSIDRLDVAALLRLVDQNWEFLRERCALSYDSRNWLKEASSVRNRVAHEAPGEPRNAQRDYRDLDTLARLAEVIDRHATETLELIAARNNAFGTLGSASSSERPVAEPSGLQPGSLVRLRARPELVGVVTRIFDGGIERRVSIFHDGSEVQYFESQIELTASAPTATLSPSQMRAGLTASLLLNPGASRLYSFNSGRIDYEPYQFRPVMKLISADRPRLLIADDVGVGKTIEAALIIKELQARQPLQSVLVICPKQLVVEHKWRNELRRFDEDFVELDSATLRYCIDETRLEGRWPTRYAKAILPYSLLDERLLLGSNTGRKKSHGLVSLIPPATFDLVVVDEAHHVRNTDTWRHRCVRHLLGSAEASVLISATPIQTGAGDLFNLLQLLRPDILTDPEQFERMREPNAFIASAEEIARRGEPNWQANALAELEAALRTTWGAAVMSSDPRSERTREVLEATEATDATRVAAVRALQGLNTFSGLINRTRRRDIGEFAVRRAETIEVDFTPEQESVHKELIDIGARIVSRSQPTMSIEFLLSTLKRQASSCINGLAPFVNAMLEGRLSEEELSEAGVEGELLQSDVLIQLRNEIGSLAERAADLEDDPKIDALLSVIAEKQEMANNKLLVFSTFRHTLAYLLPRLEDAGVRVGLVHGAIPDGDRRDIRGRFALDRSDSDAFDVLLSSEVGTEGLDNQFCDTIVNYDIPWNPMRIEQRIGRIDRRGQQSEAISIKNLIVRNTVDATIFHRCLERIGIFRQSLGGGEEILGELTKEMRAIADDLSLSEDKRDEKLRQLADNKLGRIQEQSELEEREASLFGLAVKRTDDNGVAAASSPWLEPSQLAPLVAGYLAQSGFERSDQLFDRPVAVFRPNAELRSRLLADARSLSIGGAPVPQWTRWLEAGSPASRRLTFDPSLANSDDIELLSPTHPLVRAAASGTETLSPGSSVSLVAESDRIAPGRHPFALYSWNTLGVHDSHEVRVIALEERIEADLESLLLVARDGIESVSKDEVELLEARHYDRWAEARTRHIEQSSAHSNAQLASLTLTHRARIAQLEDQLAVASHENIRRMKESELRNADADFERRTRELKNVTERCDLTATSLCSGILVVS